MQSPLSYWVENEERWQHVSCAPDIVTYVLGGAAAILVSDKLYMWCEVPVYYPSIVSAYTLLKLLTLLVYTMKSVSLSFYDTISILSPIEHWSVGNLALLLFGKGLDSSWTSRGVYIEYRV